MLVLLPQTAKHEIRYSLNRPNLSKLYTKIQKKEYREFHYSVDACLSRL